MLSDKEHFVMSAYSRVIQAVFALDVYRQKEHLGFYDSVMALSAELLGAHADSFNEYALSLGKQSQGLNQFKSNVLALTDKSKLLAALAPNKEASDKYKVCDTVMAHGFAHEKCLSLAQQLASDLNSDYCALFAEKKYKELQSVADSSQAMLFAATVSQYTQLA